VAFQPRQNRNVRTVLGEPSSQVVYFGVWLGAIITGAILIFIFAFLIGGEYKGRTQQTALEVGGPLYAKVQTTADGTKIGYVEAWKTQGEQGQKEVKAALGRGQAHYARICIGCHYGTQANTSHGPWLGDLYQTTYLYNGLLLNDANLVRFMLLGHGNMPAGIPLPEQAVDLMLYLKQQTCGTPTTDAQKAKCSLR
jgi:mono/diheme cytochrome c family protein